MHPPPTDTIKKPLFLPQWGWLCLVCILLGLLVPYFSQLGESRFLFLGFIGVLFLMLTPFFLSHVHWLMSLFVAVMSLSAMSQFSEVGEGGVPLFNSAVQVISLYVGFVWLVRTLKTKEPIILPPAFPFIFLFLAMQIISSIFSPNPMVSVVFLLRYYVPLTIFFILLFNAMKTESHLHLILWTVVLSLSATSLLEIAHQLHLINVPGLHHAELAVRGRLGGLHGGLSSTTFHLLIGITLAVNFYKMSQSSRTRLALVLCIALMLVSNAMTYSISGFLGLAVALGLSLQKNSLVLNPRKAVPLLVKTSLFGLFIIITISTLVPFFGQRLLGKYVDLQTIPYYMWASGRVGTWLGAFDFIKDHPFGVGPGNTGALYPTYLEQFPDLHAALNEKFGELYSDPENTFLFAACEAGILGFLFFALAWLIPLRELISKASLAWRSGRLRLSLLGTSIVYTLMGASLFMMTSDLLIDKYLWLLLSVVTAYPAVVSQEMKKNAV